jgi:dihydrofolate reductase
MVAIVVAHAANGVIGRDGRLPWHLPSDLRRFRELTTGSTVVMGRRTFESLPPAYRPLPKRRNGAVTYEQALPLASRVYATRVEADVDGDTYFPALPDTAWRCVEESDELAENDHRFRFLTYERAD